MTHTVTSDKLTEWLEEIFARYGAPDELVSDNGSSFTSDKFTAFLSAYNVLHTRTSVYNPQENGCVERFNRHLKTGIQAFNNNAESWKSGVHALLRHYRSTAPTADSKSPGELMFGRQIRLPYEIPLSARRTSRRSALPTPPAAPQPAVTTTPTHCRGPYRVGDQVLARRPQVLKGQSPWSKPLKVTQVLGHWTYRLSDGQKWNARKLRRFHDPELQWRHNKKVQTVAQDDLLDTTVASLHVDSRTKN